MRHAGRETAPGAPLGTRVRWLDALATAGALLLLSAVTGADVEIDLAATSADLTV